MTVGELEEKNGSVCIVGIRNADELTIAPPREEMIWVGTIFALMGTPADVKDFTRANLLSREKTSQSFVDVLNPTRSGISEAVIPPGASIIGKTLGDIRMRKSYGASAIALHRGGETFRDQLRSIELRAGDTLVLHSAWEDLLQLSKSSDFAVITDFPRETIRPKKVVHALAFFLLALCLILFTDTRLSLALFVGAIGMITTGVLSIEEAYKSVGWQSVFLLASLIPLGVAVETTGTAAWIAQKTLELIGDVPGWVLQAVVAVLATAFTLVMSNVGATVLLVPLAVNIAVYVGADPALYALIVALATSNSFILPTHQVNALIMGAGGLQHRRLHPRGQHHDRTVSGRDALSRQPGVLTIRTVDRTGGMAGSDQPFFIRKKNLPSSSRESRSGFPVCLEKASKSLTEPGSVATMRNTCPLDILPRVFFALSMGRGQFRPHASSSWSNSDIWLLHG